MIVPGAIVQRDINIAPPTHLTFLIAINAAALVFLLAAVTPMRWRHVAGLAASLSTIWLAIAGAAFGFPEFEPIYGQEYANIAIWIQTFAVICACMHIRALDVRHLATWLIGLLGVVAIFTALEVAYWRLAWGAEYHILERELLGYRYAPVALLIALASLWPAAISARWTMRKTALRTGCTLAVGATLAAVLLIVRNGAATRAQNGDPYDLWEICLYGTIVISGTLALGAACFVLPLKTPAPE